MISPTLLQGQMLQLDKVTRIELTGARVPPFPFPTYYPTRAPVLQRRYRSNSMFVGQPFVEQSLWILNEVSQAQMPSNTYPTRAP